MVENDAALHRCVDQFVHRAEDLLDAGDTRSFIVQAMQGAIARVSARSEETTVVPLHKPDQAFD